jgi:hypothetical protein
MESTRKSGSLILLLAFLAMACAGGVITPDDFGGPYCKTVAWVLAPCAIGAQYAAGGLLFSQMGVGTAVFWDPPNAWGGINESGRVDLLAPVNAAIVVPGTMIPGTTDYVAVEAGFADPGNLQLNVYGYRGQPSGYAPERSGRHRAPRANPHHFEPAGNSVPLGMDAPS